MFEVKLTAEGPSLELTIHEFNTEMVSTSIFSQ